MKRVFLLPLVFIIHWSFAQKQAPYVLLVSFDGFRYDYVTKYNAPHFKEFIRKGAAAEALIPSFPSKTFPNHYTLVTGLYPGNHGLVDNTFYDPNLKKGYGMKDRKAVEDPRFYGGTPLWQLAQQQGLKSASFFWVGSEVPIHGSYPDYYMKYDDYFPNEERIDQVMEWLKLPEAERPHFISLYFSLVDTQGHNTGPHSKELGQAVLQADTLLGKLMTGLKKVNLPVNVIVASDHGMLELKQEPETFVILSKLFNTQDTTMVFANAGSQTHIYTHKVDSIYDVLKKQENHFKVYKRNDFPDRWHYKNDDRVGDVMMVIEPYHYFLTEGRNFKAPAQKGAVSGAHGFDPALVKDIHGIFYAMGPNIKSGVTIKPFENIHVYPLIAKILGLKTPPVDGDVKVLEGIYKK